MYTVFELDKHRNVVSSERCFKLVTARFIAGCYGGCSLATTGGFRDSATATRTRLGLGRALTKGNCLSAESTSSFLYPAFQRSSIVSFLRRMSGVPLTTGFFRGQEPRHMGKGYRANRQWGSAAERITSNAEQSR
jgi:hypothetical protein